MRDTNETTGDIDGAAATGGMLSIGALSRATGVPIETLRTWERRYGYPVPLRKPSGHRVYAVDSVPRLQRIAEALARGHRASHVVAASDAELQTLLHVTSGGTPRPVPRIAVGGGGDALAVMLEAVEDFDTDRLSAQLLADWGRLGPLDFLHDRVAPLVRAIGDGWAAGRFEVRHEHFASERLTDLLRSLRLPLEAHAPGPVVVLTTLPGEQHALGLQMAALVLVGAGCHVLMLGTEAPVADVARMARERAARAVGVSISLATAGPASAPLVDELRRAMPRRTVLLVGGDGGTVAPAPGVVRIADLLELDAWGRALVAMASQ